MGTQAFTKLGNTVVFTAATTAPAAVQAAKKPGKLGQRARLA